MGLYVGRPAVWRDWTKDWSRAKKPIKVNHAVDCANRKEEFEGWSRPRRDAYVAKILPVLARHKIMGVAVGIHMDAFRREMASHPELQEMFGEPYAACFQWAVQTLLEMLDESGGRDQRVAFFHECNNYQKEAEAAFAYVKTLKVVDPRPISLTFGDKSEYVLLQAADILAYETNHLMRNPDKPDRLSWKAMNPGADLDPEKSRIRVRQYGENQMGDLISRLTAYRQKLLASGWDGKVTP